MEKRSDLRKQSSKQSSDKSGDISISSLINSSKKAELAEWLEEHLPEAEKALLILAVPDDEGLHLIGRQLGFTHQYEIDGFLIWVGNFIESFSSGD